MDKEIALRKAKHLALAFLLGSTVIFIGTTLAPHTTWIALLHASAEAAMVGALADWFAVSALFRRIPLPGLAGHTAIIPANKDKIADNLAVFVQEKFLDTASLTQLVQQRDPARQLGRWLCTPAHTERLGLHMGRAMGGLLSLINDASISKFLLQALHTAIDHVDLGRSAASLLDLLTRDGRHQQVLDLTIQRLVELINHEETRDMVATKLVAWLKQEYPVVEKILPSTAIGSKGAQTLADILEHLLNDIAQDPQHQLRLAFDREVEKLVARLRIDPAMQTKVEEIKQHLLHDRALGDYAGTLWGHVRQWIADDLTNPDSLLKTRISHAATWIGQSLTEDVTLRDALNQHIEDAVRAVGPDIANFMTRHISQTVKNWDAQALSHQVELNIGRDLQFIRINGTVVGALIGAALFCITWLMQLSLHGT